MKRNASNKLIWAIAWLALLASDAQAQVASQLYGVTGVGGDPASTLFVLNKTDASSTFVMTLGNGNDGEELAFNPDDGLLYHASGTLDYRGDNRILETIHPGTLALSNIPLSGFAYTSVAGMTYEDSGEFLISHPQSSTGISTLTSAGVAANIGSTAADFTGLAYVGATLYAVAKEDDLLRTIDPLTGATLDSVTISLSGETIYGANALATDPADGSLWAVLKIQNRFPTSPNNRALAVIDPGTGVATLVGVTDVVGVAGIAFVSGSAVTVTSSVGTGIGGISPLGSQDVISGLTTSFTLTPDPGYVIESVTGTCGGTLAGDAFTTDVITADCTVIANFEPEPTTKLYGITGDGGIPAETLFRLDTTDASTTFMMTLGNGDDGEEIAFNRDDELLYHASGTSTGGLAQIFESIDLDSQVVTDIPTSGNNYKEVSGLTYSGAAGFIASHINTGSGLSSITTAGTVSIIGSTETILTGLAYIGTTLYAVARNDNLLRTIDPATGATLGSVPITMSGYTIEGANGLTTNPDDNTLWALLKTGTNQPYDRVLATIDRQTGVATYIGTPDVVGLAGLAFGFIHCDPCDVTPSVGGGPGTISPSTVQNIAYDTTTSFTLTADPHYHVDYVDGTCGGSLAGDVFTTALIYTHCEVVAYFAIDTYDLTYTAGPGGSISGEALQTVEYNTDGTTVTAVPDDFHHFIGWSDGLMTTDRTDTAVAMDISVTANFEIDSYTVSSSVDSGLGSISPLGDQDVDHGSTAQFIVTPDTGYHIDSMGGTCGGSLSGNTYTTDPITAPCTVVANFAIDTFSLMYMAGSGGSILGTSPQIVEYGADGMQVTATPDPNHHFVDWSDGLPTASRTDTNVMADLSVTANFEIDRYTVSSSVGGGSGTISPFGSQQIDYGSTAQFSVTPDTGYHIDSIGGTCGGSLSSNTYTTEAITVDCTVIAIFAIDTFTLTYTAGPGGSITGVSPQTVNYGSDGSSVTAVADANYLFVDWSDGVTTATRTDINVMADVNVTANFAPNTHEVTSSVGGGVGTISPLGTQEINHGQTAQFTLTPGANYHIDSVGGTCGGSLSGLTYTTDPITTPCTVVANFAIDTLTLTYTAGAGGSILGVSPQTVDYGTDGTPVTADPDPNHHFVNWNDGLATATRTDTNVTADISVTANFAFNTFTVTPSVGTPSGSISPLTPQEIDYGQTTQFTLTPAANHHIDSVGGTCGGSLSGNTYTTNAITGDCTVIANFAVDTYILSSSVGTPSGIINPLGDQEVGYGDTRQFTVTPSTGYHIESMGGTCGGSLSGETYTTLSITEDCTVVANFAIDSFTLTYTAGPGGSISGSSPQTVDYGEDGTAVTADPDPNYHFVDWSDGIATATRADTNVTADISVTANFAIDTHTVTSSVGTPSGSISPSGGQEIDHGQTTQFTLTPSANYHIESVGGTCGGSLSGSTYTTDAITTDCTVVANFAIDTHTVTSSVGTPSGSISPSGGQEIDHGQTAQFTLTPSANYHIESVGGTCGGSLSGSTYTTDAITTDCTVVANFAIDTHTVTSSVGTPSGSISPSGGQEIDHGQTTQFTLTPSANYHIESVGGTCGGSLSGSTYTTDAITTDCTVVANFAIDTHTVTSSVGTPSGSISPSGGQEIDHGQTTQFTLTPSANYHIESVGGTCGGSLSGSTYTTDAITTDCTVVANFAIDTHTVTSSVGTPSGSISPSGGQEIDHGQTAQFTLTPSANYHIESVGGTCGGSLSGSTYTTDAITTDCTVVANFAIDTHTVTSSVGTPSGSISPSGGQEIDHGQTTQFTLTPSANYHIESVGGTCGGSLSGSTYTTDAITTDCTVVANFAIDTHTVTSSVGTPSGSISPSGGQEIDHGQTAQFTLTPSANYHIESVGGTCGGSLSGSTYTTDAITTDCTVVANFAIDTHTVTSSVGTPSGSISPSGGQEIDHGQTTQFTLTPSANYHIESVGGTCGGSLSGNVFTTTAVIADCSVVANYAIDTFSLTYTAGPGGSIFGDASQTVDYGTDGTPVTADPDANHHFVDWSDGVTSATRSDTNVTANVSVIANFEIDTYAVTSSVGTGSGDISPLGSQEIDHGQTAQFTLTPAANYHIESVDGTCGGSLSGNSYTTDVITADCTVVANFAIDTFTLIYTAGSGGSISGVSPQTVDYGADGTPVTAVPDATYQFVGWSDGVTTATRTDTKVMADLSVTANFAADSYTVSSSVGTGSGSINPLGDQEIDHGQTTQFTLTPAANYHIDSVGGTCGGSLAGNTYTTDPVTADCTVVANFAIDTHTVTSSVGTGSGSISPLGDQEVDDGRTTQFMLTPDTGYHIDSVGGTCGGSLSDNMYTTDPVTADCTVVVNFGPDSYTVSSSVGSGSGAISPLGDQQVDHGQTAQYTLTPAANYHIESVGGTCGGSLSGSTYTTDAITADCTVVADFAGDQEAIFSDGFEGGP